MMRRFLLFVPLCFRLFVSCNQDPALKYSPYVDVFIGTGGHGHTFPGAVLPYGMVQLSPDTRTQGWDACSGYYATDSVILGFSHTHLSGTGMSDYGDFLFTPFSCPLLLNEENQLNDYYPLSFKKENEKAFPGYYSVLLNNHIGVELTATLRAGLHRYAFNKTYNSYETGESGILIDLNHSIHNRIIRESAIKVLSNTEICGMRLTEGWAKRRYIYFHATFSKPFHYMIYKEGKPVENASELNGGNLKIALSFGNEKEILAKVGVSPVDAEGARKNLEQEIPGWDFVRIQKQAAGVWEQELRKIEVEGGTDEQKKIFYTAMYHAAIHPSIATDVDNRYRGQDLQIYTANGFRNYTVFSLWDTFRALNPYLTIVSPGKTNDFIHCLLDKYQKGGILPKWDLASCYTGTMIGYHAVSVIADAYLKGIKAYDAEWAYRAMLRSVPYDTSGIIVHHPALWEWLMSEGKKYNAEWGYIPADQVLFATSRGLEYAYDDWCIAQMAQAMGKTEDYHSFMERASHYKNYYDPQTGFMRALDSKGKWIEPFNPVYSDHMNSPYCEGNAWQWTWFVPQDIDGLINLMGGREKFTIKLDSLFSVDSTIEGENASADISGLIGQYAHGNEPSHHIVYLYNYAGQPWKTQALADRMMNELYRAAPDGLSGNEDCGQMSAWYLLSAMGFYQVAPGKPVYTLGRPLFDKVTIHLENGKPFVIEAKNNSLKNKYVKSVSLNGQALGSLFFTHQDMINGGRMIFEMQSEANNMNNPQ
ncbi:MAG: GH92 family glycosyl hydrolase [Dysgonamonadaceae bacterium]|jgi:predicted alpha-1,2-mannosidase|nr:GH92 family glycosyl hydrolase [Dysgonamonadaceae bacterium]